MFGTVRHKSWSGYVQYFKVKCLHILGTNQSEITLQANLGGRLRMVITGAAPTSPTVLSFLRAALGCQVWPPTNAHTYAQKHKKNWIHTFSDFFSANCSLNSYRLMYCAYIHVYRYMKHMDRQSAQLAAPSLLLETGLQVNLVVLYDINDSCTKNYVLSTFMHNISCE